MHKNGSNSSTQPTLSTGKPEQAIGWRSGLWAVAAIALLLFPLFMMGSLAQAATDVSGDAFPIRQCFVRDRINKITNNEMVSRFDGLNQSGTPGTIYFSASGLKWVEYSDGSARLMGDMIAIGGGAGFTVDVTFMNKAIANGNLEYDSFFGTLTGLGDYAGAVLSVQAGAKTPSFRFWNNGPDAEGWMQWVVTSQSTGGELINTSGQSGVWSFSINPNCKTMPAPTYTPVPKVPGAIGNVVFKDNNLNGIQDADDEGVAGIEVLLWTDDDEDGTPDTVIATQTTDANGNYQFQGLSPHVTYFVQFIIPADAGKLFTIQDAGANDGADSDPDPATGITGPINVEEGEKKDDVDAGVINSPASIGDLVWRDTNRNGIQDAGEPGEDGVTVILLTGSKDVLETTITANGGQYSFSNLNPKDVYRIRFEAPANTGFTSQDAGANDGADSDPALDTGQTDPISLAPGENNDTIDAGIVNDFVTLGDLVFKDDDKDGVQDAGEPGIAGVTVNLLDKGKGVLASTTTDANGKYTFSVDPKQSYIIEVVAPADKDIAPKDASPDDTADSDIGPDGRTDPIQPTPGDSDTTIDAGLSNKGASIGDTVFSDLNGDGIQDAGEPGIGGVTVNLLAKDNTVLASTTTDAGGNYGFGDLNPKQGYLIQVVIPAGKDASPQDAGGNDATDSDIDPDGMTANISLTPGEENPDVDAGLVNEPATLGDTVFSDLDGDGIQDPGEPGIAGVTVNLLDKDNTVLQTTTTDSGGNYSFTVDPQQSYIIEFVAPAEFVFTDPNEGADDATDSDANPDTGRTDPIQPTAGGNDPTIDAGLVGRKSTIGDLVFKDDNGNGQQDADEPGIEDVTVNLLDKVGNVVDTTTTGPDGSYGFSVDSTNSYVVQVVVPAGKGITTKDTGDDATDSDIGPDGKTDFIEIGPSQSDDTIDAGLVNLPGSLNGVVFNDVNQNGVQDAGDLPVPGATVQLITKDKATVLDSATTGADGSYTFSGLDPKESYRVRFTAPADTAFTGQDVGGDDAVDSDADPTSGQTGDITVPADGSTDNVDAGVIDQPGSIEGTLFKDDDGDGVQDDDEPGIPGQKVSLTDKAGNPIATATTDANGDYAFPGIDPGSDYVVVFDPVPNTVFTTQDSGADDDIDSDVDPTTGQTGSITVPANGTADNVDAGVVWIPGTLTGTVFDDINRNGVQDDGEPIREGVTVNLLDKAGNVLATATTNASGDYSFGGLDPKFPGYVVEVEEPAGKEFTEQDAGTDDTIDSDVDETTGQTESVTVPANGTLEDVDAGLVNILGGITGVVFNDLNDNGIQDAGEPVVSDVTVELISKDSATVYQTTATDGSGAYSFAGVDPKISYRVRFTAPTNQGLTTQDQGEDDTIDSDPAPDTGETDFIDVPAGETVDNVDAGVVDQPGSITGTLFKDDNGNGIQDDDEPGIPGEPVVLQDEDGNPIGDPVITDANGNYSFDDLDPNESYVVKFTEPTDTVFGPQDAGTDDTVDSDANPDTGLTGFITVPANGSTDDVDAGVVWVRGSITGVVFSDTNRNGLNDDDDEIEGAIVNLLDNGGNVLDTTTTGADGSYIFDGLDPKLSYVIDVEEPDNKDFIALGGDSDVDPDTGESQKIVVTPGGTTEVDAGVENEGGEITGIVWNDVNDNGIQDEGEPEVEGVLVELISKDGNTVFETDTTGPDGSYALLVENPKVSYRVRFTAPDGTTFTTPDAVSPAADDEGDSDADPTTGETADITVPAGGSVDNVDAGLDSAGKAGGIVWKDDNGDGLIDDDEPRLEGITVNLLTKDGDVVATVETGADGTYSFPGIDTTVSYIVEVVAPSDKDFTDPGGDSDVAPDTGRSEFVTVDPSGITPVDAGLQNKPGTVNGRVWNDTNGNGIQDGGEPSVAGVTVSLVSADKTTVVETTTTDADGNYSLPVDDPKAEYRIRVTEPAAQDFTTQGTPVGDVDDAGDSDVDPVTGQTEPFTVPADGSVDNVDAGVRDSDGKAGGVVFKDDDKDGLQDADEPTLEGITVRLLAKDGTLIAETETGADGTYSFPGVDSTVSYVVEFVLPGDKLFTSPDGDSDVDPTTGRSPSVVVPADGIVDVSAGMVNKSGTLGDTVFKDDNENGIQDAGEGGVAGVTVRLLDKGGAEIATATTGADGGYTFSVDPKLSYIIEVVEPAGYDFSPQDAGGDDAVDSDVDPTTGQTDPVTVAADGTDDSIDAGLVWEPGTIAGTAWKDDNKDGIRDDTEPSLAGIEVRLWIAGVSGNMFGSTTTDANGDYVFTNVNPKLSYNVQFTVPSDKEVTLSSQGNDDTVDSDITDDGTTKAPISVSANEDVTNVDAGFFNKSASIGDIVWNDLNRDGIQDAGEPGEPGVTVELLAKDGSVVDTTTTDGDGKYLFADVDPKQGYIVRFTAPAGKGFTTPNAGGDAAADSDAGPDGTTANISVDADEDDPTVDAGLVTTLGSISGTITKDDEPGGAVGLEGVTVQLQDKAGNVITAVTSGTDGTYVFDSLEPGSDYVIVVLAPADKNFASGDGTSGSLTVEPGDKTSFNQGLENKPATIGDKVFKDDNQNGIQDAGEPGIAGITVNLMSKDNAILQTATTDADGMYSFTVDPKGGSYVVQFELPADKEFTTPDAGTNDAEDSDVTDPATGQTDGITVGADETNPNVDAGMVNKGASVGNLVFRDLDNDGIQDAGEPGIAGVTVNLLLKDGTLVEAATTGPDGTYDFIEVDPKEGYEVEFVAPAGETFTTPDVGTDDTIDSDAGPDGTTDGSITVAAGEDNPTVDAGLATVFDLALRKTIGEAEKLVLDGDDVIFQIEVCNQGNVSANSIKIVDYIPGAFTLVDPDWADEGTQATFTLDGPLAPGACEMVEITLEAAFSPARTFEFVSNKAEIYEAKDEGGNVRTSDVDSTYDRVELNDPVIDDEINLTPAGGDEDDHDKAIVQVLPRDLGTSGDVNADGQRTAVDALHILRGEVGIAPLPVSETGRSGLGSQEEVDAWCAEVGVFGHNESDVSGDFDGDDDCDGDDYGDYVCDVSGDNQCNSIDALFILQCDVGLSNAFCAQ